MEEIMLSISILVSGREETTEKCLQSLQPLKKKIPCELILIDTSNGNSLVGQMIDRYADKKTTFTWCDDFAAARNVGVEMAEGKWFLFLDDDEWFENTDHIANFFLSGEYQEYEQAVYLVRNYLNLDGSSYSEDWVSRMIHLTPETRFVGRVHESLEPVRGKCKKLYDYVHHYGYAFPDEESRLKHAKRNISILNDLLVQEPNNMKWPLQLLQEYSCIHDTKHLLEVSEAALQKIKDVDEDFMNQCRGSFYTAMLQAYLWEEQYDLLFFNFEEYRSDSRNCDAGICAMLYIAVMAAMEQQNYEAVIGYCKEYETHYKQNREEDREEQQQIINESIVLVSDYVNSDAMEQIDLKWMQALMELNLAKEYPIEKALKWKARIEQEMEHNADFLILSDFVWKTAEQKLLPLEDMILQLPLSQWIAQTEVLRQRYSLAEWDQIWNHLRNIQTKNDIRYDFFAMSEAKILIRSGVRSSDYQGIKQLLQFYYQYTMRYARQVYTEAAFTGEMEILPKEIRGAYWIEHALDGKEEVTSEQLEYLNLAVHAWDKLAKPVKIYVDYLKQMQLKQQQENQAARQQFEQLAVQVKLQIRDLLDAGQYQQAKEIIGQLKTLTPGDSEIAEFEKLLLREENREKDIVLSIGLLVSNRRDTIKECLDSVQPIRDAIPTELILIDTGCDADVRQILEQYGDKVAEFEWCNDFSIARNELLKYATGEWFLYLDDDEWFVDTAEIIEFFRSGEYQQYGYASYIQRNFLDMEATQYTDSWVSRMAKRTDELHFESKIHEYMTPVQGDCKGLRSIVHHFGYVYPDKETQMKHFERNRVLLEEMILEEPHNLRWLVQLAQEYRGVEDYEDLLTCGKKGIAQTEAVDEMYSNIARGAFYASEILALKGVGQYKEAEQICLDSLEDKRNTQLYHAYACLRLCECYYELGEFKKAENYAKEYLKWKSFFDENEPLMFLQSGTAFIGECFDEVMYKEAISILICSGLKQNNTNYLNEYVDELRWGEEHIYVYEHMMEAVVEALCTISRADEFEKILQIMYANEALWAYFVECCTEYENRGNDVGTLMNTIQEIVPQSVQSDESEIHAVKEQLQLLIQNGLADQARQIIPQLRKLFPDDEELKQLESKLQDL